MDQNETSLHSWQTDPLSRLLEAIPLVIVIVDKTLKIQWINARGVAFFGRHRDVLIGQSIAPTPESIWTWSDNRDFAGKFESILGRGGSASWDDCRCRIPVGGREREHSLKITASPFDHGGEPMALVIFEEAETNGECDSDMGNLERLAHAIQMARSTTHDLNQPLSVLMGNLDLLLCQGLVDGPLKERITRISKSADQVAQIVHELQEILRSAGERKMLKASPQNPEGEALVNI
jgi:signal transduction histidine kinase